MVRSHDHEHPTRRAARSGGQTVTINRDDSERPRESRLAGTAESDRHHSNNRNVHTPAHAAGAVDVTDDGRRARPTSNNGYT